jgi:hypothetical protein
VSFLKDSDNCGTDGHEVSNHNGQEKALRKSTKDLITIALMVMMDLETMLFCMIMKVPKTSCLLFEQSSFNLVNYHDVTQSIDRRQGNVMVDMIMIDLIIMKNIATIV